MIKVTAEVASLGALILAGAWLFAEKRLEPAVAFATAYAVVALQIRDRLQSDDTSSILGRLVTPIHRWHQRRKPLSAVSFNTLHGAAARHHSVEARAIWGETGPRQRVELRQRQDKGDWATIAAFDGHEVSLKTRDIDSDGSHELLVRYHAGAHTHVLQIFKVSYDGELKPMPGSHVGSDWPELAVEDRDGDGCAEIYAKHRNWSAESPQVPVTEVYELVDGSFHKRDGTTHPQ